MGFTDAVGGIIDKGADVLGASDSKSGPKPEAGKPEYTLSDDLDPPKDKKGISTGPNAGDTKPNTASLPDAVEFVHYGYVHFDTSDHFAHPKFDPAAKKDDNDNDKDKSSDDKDKDKDKTKKPAGRGIMFRDAIEREMVLLHGFISSTKAVHEELQKNQGLVGAAAGAIGSLIGSSGKEPVPGSLTHLLDNITAAGETINADACDYVKIHKAGIDLHQVRADYTKYCKEKLYAYYVDGNAKGKGGADPTAILYSLPGVSGAIKTVFGILFKAFDIYFGMYLNLRETYERAIEDACHTFSLKVVRAMSVPTYSCWFGKGKDDSKPDKSDTPLVGQYIDDFNKYKKDVTDEIGYDDKPPPGEDAVIALFAIFGAAPTAKEKEKDKDKADPPPPSKDAPKPIPKPADEVCISAFNSILGHDLPGFLAKATSKIIWGNLEFLKVVYLKMCKEPVKKIDIQWLEERALETLENPMYGFIEDSVSFIKKIEDFNFDVMGTNVGPQKLVQQGKDALTEKLAGYCDPVLKLAVGRFAKVLEDARADANKNKQLTMETFLSRLPFHLAFQVRNCTFPMWKTIIDNQLGKANTALSKALKPVTDFIGEAKDVAGDVKDYKDRAGKVMDKYDKEGLSGGTNSTSNNDGYMSLISTSTKKDEDATKGGNFPGGKRTETGTAEKIPSDDFDKAKKDRKDPWPPVDKQADAAAAGSSSSDAGAAGGGAGAGAGGAGDSSGSSSSTPAASPAPAPAGAT